MDPVIKWLEEARDVLDHVNKLAVSAHCNPKIGVQHLVDGLASLAFSIKASEWLITIYPKGEHPQITNQSAERDYTAPDDHCIRWTFELTDKYGNRWLERGKMIFWRNINEPPFEQQQKQLVKVAGQLVELLFVNPSIMPRQVLVDVESIGQAP